MIIGIVSDTHFGYSGWPEDALKQGREAILKAAEEADVLLIPGDIFDKEKPSIDIISQLLNILLELEDRGWGKNINVYDDQGEKINCRLPIAVIRGTHERVEKNKTDPIEFVTLTKYWINVHNKGIVFEKENEKLRIFGMGGVPEDLAKESIRYIDPKPKPNMFNMFVLHQTFNELIPIHKEEFLCYENLPKNFDLYVNGHIHKQMCDLDGKFIIPGSTVITQLKPEEQDPKGYILYDTERKTHEFREINSRPFVIKKLKFENAKVEEVKEKIENEIQEIVNQHNFPIIRIIIQGNLVKGLKPTDIILNFSHPNAFKIYVDNQFEGQTIESTINKVKDIKKEFKDPKKIGYSILLEKLKDIDFKFKNIDELFESIGESVDKGLEYVEETNLD